MHAHLHNYTYLGTSLARSFEARQDNGGIVRLPDLLACGSDYKGYKLIKYTLSQASWSQRPLFFPFLPSPSQYDSEHLAAICHLRIVVSMRNCEADSYSS